jgi:two-component system phosphate regulon sensor histidine kinase PhoR
VNLVRWTARWRERFASVLVLPAVLVAVGILAYFTFRTTLQVERLRQQSVLEATLGLANEKASRLDQRIIEQDDVIFALADPARLTELAQRWLPTAQRETPTVRAVLVLDDNRSVMAFASRAGSAFADEEAFRRLLVQRMVGDMELGKLAPDELHHLHHEYRGQSYLVSYWERVGPSPRPLGASGEGQSQGQGAGDGEPTDPRVHHYLVVAWYDLGRIVHDAMPTLFSEASTSSRVNVVDEGGRIIFGPPLRSGEFTVGVRFPTTLYNWRLQVSPTASDELTSRVRNRALLELVMVVLSCGIIVLGVAATLLAAARERRTSTLKSEFVANVSHELKTPLALVRMFGEMLQSGRVTSEAKRQQYLDIIMSESERLSALIENVLDFARVERGKQPYDLAEGSVGDAVSQAVNVYRHRAESEGIGLVAEIERDLPRARIDERAIQLAVINLIDNALKYAPGTGIVTVRASRENGAIVVRVIDRGPGVPPEERERIFERFVRGSTSRSSTEGKTDGRRIRGSGIGLSLVKHIAESHGGRAWVERDGQAPASAHKGEAGERGERGGDRAGDRLENGADSVRLTPLAQNATSAVALGRSTGATFAISVPIIPPWRGKWTEND